MKYVTETEVPVVFCEAHDKGGVNEMVADVDFVHIVVETLPQVAVMVCVKLVATLMMVKVCAVPSVPFATDKVDFLGIVVNVCE